MKEETMSRCVVNNGTMEVDNINYGKCVFIYRLRSDIEFEIDELLEVNILLIKLIKLK